MKKLQRYDWVKIKKKLRPSMSHFTSGKTGIVLHSYGEEFLNGTEDKDIYSLYIRGKGVEAWYHREQLMLLKHGCSEKLNYWKEKHEE